MWWRMTLPVGVLFGGGTLGCSLNLDFERFEFTGPDAAMSPSGSPAVASDPQQAAPVRCSPGDRRCVGESLPANVPGDAVGIDGASRGRDAGSADGMDAPRPPDPGDAAPVPRTCDRCSAEENCVLGLCQAPASSCAALKELDPTLADGIYSIVADGLPRRTYCDMTARLALCSEGAPSDHEGVTRDPSQLPFVLSSVLEGDECRVWNVRACVDGRPLDGLATSEGGETVLPCTPLGFRSDPPGFDATAGCRYGQNMGYGTCGFDTAQPLLKWANLCTCEREVDMNRGFWDRYVLQGTIFVSVIPWDASGSVSVRCGT